MHGETLKLGTPGI